MERSVRARFWLEAAACVISALALVATLLWRDWIEIVFRVDPDNGSGALEWAIVAVAALVTAALFIAARVEWLRARPAPET